MMWLAEGEKKIKDVFIRFDRIHEHDGHTDKQTDRRTDRRVQTDGRTPHDSIGFACIASRANKRCQCILTTQHI